MIIIIMASSRKELLPCELEHSRIGVEAGDVKLSFVGNDSCEASDAEPGADRHS